MGGRKKNNKQNPPAQKQTQVSNEPKEEKRFVNLLHVYTIYKQRFRRLTKEEFEELLRHGCKGKRAAIELCKEFMKAKQIPDEINFEKNVGYLSVPRFMPLIALLAERAGFKIKPSQVARVNFAGTPERFREKFSHLLVYGFWFLGRVIMDSLSVKEQVNRGNMFNFAKGDMGYWWAGVRILDWNSYVNGEKLPEWCKSFVSKDPPKYRFYTSRAIINMHQHPLYFLSKLDWDNYLKTVETVRHPRALNLSSSSSQESSEEDEGSSSFWTSYTDYSYSESDVSSLSSSMASLNTLASRESVD